ncbi:hypothetical protein [Flavobacterium ovatum]|uniref:LIC_10190 family membrane protein n=1 Tax=Flavobacterium ovatum TaxID=1928857 RepID=UPI003450F94C
MILILISWIYIIFSTINLGVLLNKVTQLKNTNFVICSLLGLFTTTILASFWAIFGRINIEFHLFLLVLNGILFLKLKSEVLVIYKLFFRQLKSLSRSLKIILTIISFLILAQCAAVPYIIDNESYYIQTIKWINNYGFVKGLANLHLSLAQTSGWHITQSAYNFSFIYKNFNDLSGFCLLLGNIFAISHLNSFFKTKEKNALIIGLLPLSNVFLFPFISSPSTDLPVYILSFIIFYLFIKDYNNISIETFNLIAIFVFFIVYIKVTFIAITLILLFLFFKHRTLKITTSIIIGSLVVLLFLTKNTLISGYPLFPITTNPFSFDFQIPESIAHFYYDENRRDSFAITKIQFEQMSPFGIFKIWLCRPFLDGIINKLIIVLIIIMPFFIKLFFNKKYFWSLYTVFLFHVTLLLLSSPQYRFFMNFVLLFLLMIISLILNNEKKIITTLYLSVLIVAITLFIPINLSVLTKNTNLTNNSIFNIDEIFHPHKNSKFDIKYKTIKNGNLEFNSPVNNSFFWETGDGRIPCVSQNQIEYFEKYYKIAPQMRTINLKDGFYAKSL